MYLLPIVLGVLVSIAVCAKVIKFGLEKDQIAIKESLQVVAKVEQGDLKVRIEANPNNPNLLELKEVLNSPRCDLDILPKKKGEESHDPYTTENTLIDLEYDTHDVKAQLKNLTEHQYIETIKDNKNEDRPHFWVFGKEINLKEVYRFKENLILKQ